MSPGGNAHADEGLKRLMKKLVLLAVLLVAAPAWARSSAPEPVRAVSPSFYTGRWYEIARTENARQANCEAPTYQFAPRGDGKTAQFVLTCHRGSPAGKAESLKVNIRVPQEAPRNKFTVTAFGGVLSQEYWVLDIAEDRSWAILATPGGNYVWLLARQPIMGDALKAQLLNRIRSLGYDMSRIEQPTFM